MIDRQQQQSRLSSLNARVKQDLGYLNYPPANWSKPVTTADGGPVSDVVVIGGGMCGLVAWHALTRAGIVNLRIVDRAPKGLEGPWLTYARMETLRSPKILLGPALGVASLSFRAWFTALYGEGEWEELYRIPRPMWMDYLSWYREVMDVPVENDTHVTRILPREDSLLELEIAGGARPSIVTRKLVMATGRDGLGEPTIPDFVKGMERHRSWAHSADEIDFDRLKGKRVVVIGVGASAVDNAAEALEQGAGEVRLLARRKEMPTINKLMGIGSYGVIAGFAEISPEWRWRLMDYAAKQQTPAPHNSTLRVSRHPNAYFHFGCAIASMKEEDGEVVITTTNGRVFRTDFVILGTGFSIDPMSRSELAPYQDRIACWEDRYDPPAGEENPGLGRFPWLNGDFSFTEKEPGTAPWLKDIHCFNYGASVSVGKVSGDIPAISEGALWLARGVAASLFIRDVDYHWEALLAYEKPELDGTEWTDADAPVQAQKTA
ncbi:MULTISPECIES: NAD(P)/FAD-dependent oxidoreductase [unclassified Shinella]|uniref:NAD(P)-binding domain-containing protein n=1 Tax=unclassified Shinella TaxID=2643062 RepID=UPI00225C8670|nr:MULTISPECIES: NAD(P)/FAD-dependent oxidoreductase [unclassified Shinella]MCO5139564.1 NAD(P)/FAD-dependent oxidoreductase [Shinella sp.]MDC7258437.1 NAD(P)/FAD-dependent oxidoreductase [Shinella sp. YE25]CAI0334773.1 Predicted flavoprotein CzcO associated with the cation diffusion facilitator CzcD [Rhizobiaceae bacterium]CAK7260198.1 FAD-dependent urate hydroxylase [Shinella sp. WSC3-e]